MEHAEPVNTEHDFERPLDPRRHRAGGRKALWTVVLLAALALAAFFIWRSFERSEPVAVAPAASAPSAARDAAPPAPTAPRFPIEAATPAAVIEDKSPLPSIADSDAPLQDLLASLFAGAPIDRIFHSEDIVPRFVATIDNLPRKTVAQSRMAVNPIGGSVETAQSDGRTVLRTDNALRYDVYMRTMERTDTSRLVGAYVRYYPLFQKAYEDLGYPHGYFNDRLVEVIDHLLATPEVPSPIALAQPKVLYEFADPALEARSAGQKILLRMGPVHESRVKAKLRDIRRGITGQQLPR
ncbi:MAG: DUF3014 domain-containing protein [Betaproteobacteria bacterium]